MILCGCEDCGGSKAMQPASGGAPQGGAGRCERTALPGTVPDTPNSDAVERAMAWADNRHCTDQMAKTLASAVRSLRAENILIVCATVNGHGGCAKDHTSRLPEAMDCWICKAEKAEAELAALRKENAGLDILWNRHLTAREQAEADLAALKARTCATCRHSYLSKPNPTLYCQHEDIVAGRGSGQMRCVYLNFTCGAWAAKEQA
jgi:hypothetical protein